MGEHITSVVRQENRTQVIHRDCYVTVDETTESRVLVSNPGPQGVPGVGPVAGFQFEVAENLNLELQAGVRTALPLSILSLALQNVPPEIAGHDWFAGDRFRPFGTVQGGKYRVRMNLDLTPNAMNNSIEVELTIDMDTQLIDSDDHQALKDANVLYRATPLLDFFCWTTFIATGGQIWITSQQTAILSRMSALVTVEKISI